MSERRQHDAYRIASQFGLRYQAVVADSPRATSRYGVCYEDGLIKIRLNHATTGRPLKYSSLIDTLCHELAHLKHFNHGPQFKSFFFELLGWSRKQGIYAPGPRRGGGRTVRRTEPVATKPPASLAPPRRNGVPIFPQDKDDVARPGETLPLPWETAASAAAGGAPVATDRAPRGAARRAPTKATAAKPRQLRLF